MVLCQIVCSALRWQPVWKWMYIYIQTCWVKHLWLKICIFCYIYDINHCICYFTMLLHYIACYYSSFLQKVSSVLHCLYPSFHPGCIIASLTPPQNYDALNSGPTLSIPAWWPAILTGFLWSSCRSQISLTLILLTWRIWWVPNNASRWQMGFNLAFKPHPANVENMESS